MGEILGPSFHFVVVLDFDLWGERYFKLFKIDLEITTEATLLEHKEGAHFSFVFKELKWL